MNDLVPMIDANGKAVVLTQKTLNDYFTANISTVMGLSLEALSRFRCEYFKRGGVVPITPEAISAVFSNQPQPPTA